MLDIIFTSADAEQALIGCLVAFPDRAIDLPQGLAPHCFSSEIGRKAFEAIKKVIAQGIAVDPVVVSKECPECRSYLVEALTMATSSANIPQYAEMVVDGYIRRTAAGYSDEIRMAALDGGTREQILDSADKLHELLTGSSDEDEVAFESGMSNFMERQQKSFPDYIRTGFSSLDRGMYIERGDFIVIGARPSVGKTAFAIQLAAHISKERKVAFFSLETRTEKIYDRLAANIADISFGRIKNYTIRDDEMDRAEQETLQKRNLVVINAAGKSVQWIQAKTRKLKAEVVFIDYLSLIAGKGNGEFEIVTQLSRDLHTFAQSTKTAVFALSQLRRTGGDVPTLTDLRQSGQIEQDADAVLLLHGSEDKRDVIVAKNKEGIAGVVIHFDFEGAKQRFMEIDGRH